MKPKANYACIDFNKLEKLKLNHTEYLVCDLISKLSNSNKYEFCLMSKATIAKSIKLSERAVSKIINKLYEKGFLIRSDQGKYRASEKWTEEKSYEQSSYPAMNNVPKSNEQSSYPAMNNVPKSNEQSSHYIINNTSNIKNQPTKIKELVGFSEEDHKETNSGKANREMYDKWFKFYPRKEQNEKAWKVFFEFMLWKDWDNLVKATRNYIARTENYPADKLIMPVNFLKKYKNEL